MTSFTEKIEALIFEIKNELGKTAAKPITLELAKASLAARKLETQGEPMEHVGVAVERQIAGVWR